ncbi:MAG: UvrD-helicase domain-containing protein [Gemmatimonadales bacterium]
MATASNLTFIPTDRQRDAIEAELGPLLVLAGPGAGKTFCLIERIRYLIEAKGFDPCRICAVTFTNKAAEEIAERLETAFGQRAHAITRGTLHSLCVRILREHGEWVGARRGFGIADEDYQRDVLRRLRVPEKARGPVLIRFGLHRSRGTPLSPNDLKVFAGYREYLERRGLLDFDDLIARTADLLTRYAEIAEPVAGQWDYLLVDEFQDLNPRQYAVIRLLASGHRNLFAVGDDEQSVYSWAGADPKVLADLANDFGIRRKLILDENRRTARQIFETARRLLEHNPRLFEEKRLRADRETEHPVSVEAFPDDGAELRWLLADLVADRSGSSLSWNEYGLLYRTHDIGHRLEAALVESGIPCRLAAGRALGDDPVVRYLLAALGVVAAPDDPLRQEAFLKEVLPEALWSGIVSEAERRKVDPQVWMRTVGRQLGRGSEDARKLGRAVSALRNLPALAGRHQRLVSLVEELLSQRVGEYRTVLEDHQDELSDPLEDGAVVQLAARLETARHGRRRVRLPRFGGGEIALSGLLQRAGVPSVGCGEGGVGNGDEVVIRPEDGGRYGLAFGLFKALQLLHTQALEDAFRDFVAVDIETSGFDRTTCEIIDLGAVRVRNGQMAGVFSELVRPRGPVAEESRRVHHITDDMLAGKPTLEAVWPAFRAFCGEDILIAHNGNQYDFHILRRLGGELGGGADFVTFDSLLLARQLHPGSRKLEHLAEAYGIEPPKHRAVDDARTLAQVFPRLSAEKLARARKTALSHLLDYLGLALVLSEPGSVPAEAAGILPIAKAFALGRYSDCLEHYQAERKQPGAEPVPTPEEVIELLGGRRKLLEYRREKGADERYPAAMARLRRLLETVEGNTLGEQLEHFLDRVALSHSGRDGRELDRSERVNLLTLHSTKGLEFSRVYVVGVEDGQFARVDRDGRGPSDEELHEARRLLYVGMTRAKDRLILTRSMRRGGLPTGGCRFLDEMGLSRQSSAFSR